MKAVEGKESKIKIKYNKDQQEERVSSERSNGERVREARLFGFRRGSDDDVGQYLIFSQNAPHLARLRSDKLQRLQIPVLGTNILIVCHGPSRLLFLPESKGLRSTNNAEVIDTRQDVGVAVLQKGEWAQAPAGGTWLHC
jgi:hypothetical protein